MAKGDVGQGMTQWISLTALIVGLGAVLGIAPKATAQGTDGTDANNNDQFRRDRNTSVVERRKERDDGGGLRMGSFRVSPQLDIAAGYTDNFGAAELNPEGSAVYSAEGRVDIASDWGRHALNASVFVPSTFYASNWTTTDYALSLGGRIDVDRSLVIDAGVGYGKRIEPLGFSDTGISLSRPLSYDHAEAHVGVSKTFSRLRIAGRAAYGSEDFRDAKLADGTPVSFDERDVSTLSYGLRADYAVSDTTSLFVSADANDRDHDLDPPDVALSKDSNGYQYLVGVNFDITDAMRGEIAVGSLTQTHDNPGVEDQTGLAARGQVEWFPDELVTITLGAERTIQDSHTADAATIVGTNANLAVDYEFRRNITLGISAGYSADEYDQIDRDDRRWDVYAAAEYEVNRTLSVTFSAGHLEQSSDGADAGRNYDANVGFVGIRLRR